MNFFRFFARIRLYRWMLTPCIITIIVLCFLFWNGLIEKMLEKKEDGLFSAANEFHRNLAQNEMQNNMDPKEPPKYHATKEEKQQLDDSDYYYEDYQTEEEDLAYNVLMNG